MIERTGGDGLRRIGIAAWSLLGTLLLLWAFAWIIGRVWILIPSVVLAIAIVYVLNPVVSALQERGMARWMGSCVSYLALMAVFTLLGFLVVPSFVDQGSQLAEDFPKIYDDLVADLESLAGDLGFDDLDLPGYEELRQRVEEDGGDFVSERLGEIFDFTLGVLEAIALLILAPVIAFYVLLDLPTLRDKTVALIPARHRDETAHVAGALGTAVGGFLRGQLFVAVIVGVMTSVGFRLIGLPFWLLIGMIAGFLNIIPLVGPWVGGFLGVSVAIATSDLQTAIWAGVVALVVQQIDNHFISPAVLRATVRIHPAMILLGLVGGAAIFGFWGVVLAVPTMAIVKILTGHFWRTRVLGQSWEEASEAVIDTNVTSETFITRRLRRALEDEDPGPPGAPPPLT
ncbi:MAG: AI-2E family transporter [Acidimicrobiia bacterium]|nr:AI-2E family transporter [Acidimicrobiia bacterium]